MNELIIRLTGAVSESNLDSFKEKALADIKAANKDLVTEEDFANAETVIKKCSETEKMIVKTKEDALNQTADIRKLFSSLDELSAELRTTRLALEKKVVSEKEKRKTDIINTGIKEVETHIALTTKGPRFDDLDGLLMVERENIKNAIKGKKTLKGMEEAVSLVVTWNIDKIELNKTLFISNIVKMEQKEEAYPGLFPDKKSLCIKPTPELVAIIDSRIATYKLQAEEKRKRDEKEALETQNGPLPAGTNHPANIPESFTDVIPKTTPTATSGPLPAGLKYRMTIEMRGTKADIIAIAESVDVFLAGNDAVTKISLMEA